MDLAGEEQYRVTPNIPPYLCLTETQVIVAVKSQILVSVFSFFVFISDCVALFALFAL